MPGARDHHVCSPRKSARCSVAARPPPPHPPRPGKEGGKGRPTPSRKEARPPPGRAPGPRRTRRPRPSCARQRRTENNARAREGMRTGDERYLPARDKGPVRRFVRDWVDSRLCMAELLLPLLVVIMIGQAVSRSLANGLWSATILLVALDTAARGVPAQASSCAAGSRTRAPRAPSATACCAPSSCAGSGCPSARSSSARSSPSGTDPLPLQLNWSWPGPPTALPRFRWRV